MIPILGKAVATAEQMASYLLSVNPSPKIPMDAVSFCRLFLYMGAVEGVRGDILFAQSCKETGNFKFKGTVKENQNNFAGLGTTNTETPGAVFPDAATGILAQAQHAKGYDGTPLNFECVDPRYEVLVKYKKIGIAKHWEELGGSWAVPGYSTSKYSSLEEANAAKDSYGYQIISIYNKIVGTVEEPKVEQPEVEKPKEEVPAKKVKVCLDAGHFKKYNRCPGIPEYYESEMVWKLHLLLKKYLEQLGIEVVTTRADKNKDLDLKERGMASQGCDLFLSLHSNAVGGGMNEGIDHVAVYHLVNDTTTDVDEISKAFAEKIAPVIAQTMGVEDGFKILTKKSENDRNKDGIFNDNYYGVLNGARLANTPGLILEHGFHTHSKTVRWLLDDANLDKLAKEEAECIYQFFFGKEVTVKPSGTTETKSEVPFTIRVANVSAGDVLNIRKEPSTSAVQTGALAYNDPNIYTIVEERNGWGRLKSGIGWIYLKYTKRV